MTKEEKGARAGMAREEFDTFIKRAENPKPNNLILTRPYRGKP